MIDRDDQTRAAALSPSHAILLAFLFPLTLGAALSDWAYWSSFQVQWANFSEWLLLGASLGGAAALAWSLIGLLVPKEARRDPGLPFILFLAATLLVNVVNSLVHGKDAFAIMPAGLILSVIAAVLAFITSWMGFSGRRYGRAR